MATRREASAGGGTDPIIEFVMAEDYEYEGHDVKLTIHLEDSPGDIVFVFI